MSLSDAPAPSVLPAETWRPRTLGELMPEFLAYAKHEWRFSPHTLEAYAGHLRRIAQSIGDIAPNEITEEHILGLKADAVRKGTSAHHVKNIVAVLKSFLRFCRLVYGMETLDPRHLRYPRIPKREVLYLTPDEVEVFLSAVPVYKSSRVISLKWLMVRALAETLLGTALRIGEALCLIRSSINFETGEARVLGKGNKERTVFFTPRSLSWLKEYVSRRQDSEEELFVLPNGNRVRDKTVQQWFRQVRAWSGIRKQITPHILRHTAATTLLFNGCPIGHIREILGHENLETTCKYYLGTDKRAAKEAHRRYLTYEVPSKSGLSE